MLVVLVVVGVVVVGVIGVIGGEVLVVWVVGGGALVCECWGVIVGLGGGGVGGEVEGVGLDVSVGLVREIGFWTHKWWV